jgi:urease accessory protein
MNDSQPTSPWLLWQVIDSAFPVGGFAHSGGLEAAVQLGFVKDAETLAEFARVSLTQSARFAAPFIAAVTDDPEQFAELNRRYDIRLTNDPANRASRALGAAVLTAGEATLPTSGLGDIGRGARKADGFVHYPPAWGLLADAVGMSADEAIDAFLFQQGRSILSAAVRLGVIGPMQSQQLMIRVGQIRQKCLDLSRHTTPDTASATAPTLDLLQSLHERLYSRLFNS